MLCLCSPPFTIVMTASFGQPNARKPSGKTPSYIATTNTLLIRSPYMVSAPPGWETITQTPWRFSRMNPFYFNLPESRMLPLIWMRISSRMILTTPSALTRLVTQPCFLILNGPPSEDAVKHMSWQATASSSKLKTLSTSRPEALCKTELLVELHRPSQTAKMKSASYHLLPLFGSAALRWPVLFQW